MGYFFYSVIESKEDQMKLKKNSSDSDWVKPKDAGTKIILMYSKFTMFDLPWLSPQYTKDGINYNLNVNKTKFFCPVDCIYTHNQDFLPVAHAVLFEVPRLNGKKLVQFENL